MKNYVYELFSDESKRLINQISVRAKMPGDEAYGANSCWDGVVAPDGRFYYPLSSENGYCMNTKLAYFDYEKDELVVCFDASDVLLHPIRKLPHSKFHTSLNVIPRHALYPEEPYDEDDYLLIGVTHSTDRAPHHQEWMPFGHHNHVWEGFPGSQILVWDPKTERGMSLGTPVPQESIYGAKYDPKHNRLYMIGFMRGHVYCYDLNERRVIKDLGKVAEIFCYRLTLGADGNIYGCTKSGQMFKIHTDTIEVENLEFHVPDVKNNYVSYSWYRYMCHGRNHRSGKFMYFTVSSLSILYKLDFATGQVTEVGKFVPGDGLYELGCDDVDFTSPSFEIDKDGVLWIVVRGTGGLHNQKAYNYPTVSYLIRWDVEKGEEPFCCGVLGKTDVLQGYVTEVEYDHKRDRLFWVDQVCTMGEHLHPSVGGMDLAPFREVYRERGPVCTDPRAQQKKLTPEQIEKRRKRVEQRVGEENAANNPFWAFHPSKVEAIRIWRSVPRLEVEDSKVIGMVFDPDAKGCRYKLHVVSGKSACFDSAAFVMEIVDGKVTSIKRFAEISEVYKIWLRDNILPQPACLDASIKLPEVTGRRYRAKAACVVDWKDGKKFVGTLDAVAAIVSPDGSVYGLGNAAAYGPIRSMCTNKAKTHLWGVAGDDEDLGYVFEYDDVNGLRQMGIINYNIHGYFDGPTVANTLSSICLSPDEKYLAIGSADRIAEVHVMDIG